MSARGDDTPDRGPDAEQEAGPSSASAREQDREQTRAGGKLSGGTGGGAEVGPDGPDADGQRPDADPDPGTGPDEESLRQLMRQSVLGLEPSPAALDELRRAVPRRRARKRQVLIGAVATVVVGAAAVPALSQGDLVPGGGSGSVRAGDERHEQSPTVETGEDGGTEGGSPGEERSSGKDGRDPDHDDPSAPSDDETPRPDVDSTVTAAATCGSEQLGGGSTVVGAPDELGRVQGSFRVVNVSGTSCQVEGDGVIGASPQGTSRAGGVQVMRHTPGDPSGLPPAEGPAELVLEPGSAYVVKFSWVPDSTGASGGCADTPPPNASGGATGDGPELGGVQGGAGTPNPSTSGDAGDTPPDEGGEGDSGGGSGSVTLSHVPEQSEAAVADTVLPNACAGTVYRTGVLAGG
ncbi:hypothetical protein [Streptomyces oceani]|uniref:hypothetical protein n=1 Tax=Streptomyces oceani TaxID=1075402 RepID=UPI0009A0AE43|nr:hypothetical protein [Streptomyces oceani]